MSILKISGEIPTISGDPNVQRPKRSTVTALSNFTDEVLHNMEKGRFCGAVFLDLTKAFDTVDH